MEFFGWPEPPILALSYRKIRQLLDSQQFDQLLRVLDGALSSPSIVNASFLSVFERPYVSDHVTSALEDGFNHTNNHTTATNALSRNRQRRLGQQQRALRIAARATNSKIPAAGVSLARVRMAMASITQECAQHLEVLRAMANAVSRLVHLLPHCAVVSFECLRLYLILPELPWMLQPSQYHVVLERFCSALVRLTEARRQVLVHWWSQLQPEFFERVLDVLSSFLSFLLTSTLGIDNAVSTVTIALSLLHRANNEYGSSVSVVPYTRFYNREASERTDLTQHYTLWSSGSRDRVFSFLHYPFLLDAPAKTTLLRIDSRFQMGIEYTRAILERAMPLLVIQVRRAHVVADALARLENLDSKHLKRPLSIEFVGEPAVDGGGPTKEFFRLLTTDILASPEYAMFTTNPSSKLVWFNAATPYRLAEYRLVGTLFGLAIYNSVIIDAPFPLALYKKLLGLRLDLEEDLAELDPELARSLQQILELEPEDVESLELTHEIVLSCPVPIIKSSSQPDTASSATATTSTSTSSTSDASSRQRVVISSGSSMVIVEDDEDDTLPTQASQPLHTNGHVLEDIESEPAVTTTTISSTASLPTMATTATTTTLVHSLVESGRNIPVTADNRKRFVELYVQFILCDSIAAQFEAFCQGFYLVCNERLIKQLFHPRELELLTIGSPVLDFHELERVTVYGEGYTAKTPVVRWFWDTVHSLDAEYKRKFLQFCTGTTRAPIQGLGHIKFAIQRSGTPDTADTRLPVAHVCVNLLDLPPYSSLEVLRARLLVAICETDGFGLQ